MYRCFALNWIALHYFPPVEPDTYVLISSFLHGVTT